MKIKYHTIACAIHCNFLKEVRLGGWSTEGPKAPTLDHTLECVHHHSVRKWKYILRCESIYFFVEVGLSPNYILPLPNRMVAHGL